jgi:hypothetical protein
MRACLTVLLLLVAAPGGPARPRPSPCVGVAYTITDPFPFGLAALVPPGDVLVMGAGTVELEGACPARHARLRVIRHGETTVRARWPRCPELRGAVTLTARITADCETVRAVVHAPKDAVRHLGILGFRSVCGDGVLDYLGDGLCDPGSLETGDVKCLGFRCTATCTCQ